MVQGSAGWVALEAQSASRIALGIAIYDKGLQALLSQSSAQIDSGGRLADSTLLIGNGDDAAQYHTCVPAAGESIRAVKFAQGASVFGWTFHVEHGPPVGPRGEASLVSHPNVCTVRVAIAPVSRRRMPSKMARRSVVKPIAGHQAGSSAQACREPRQISRLRASGKGIGVFQAINPSLARRTSSR
jgi:hypothetical protein